MGSGWTLALDRFDEAGQDGDGDGDFADGDDDRYDFGNNPEP